MIRLLDPRTFTPQTLTLNADQRLDMPSLTSDNSDCWSQVEVRGNTLVQGIPVQTQPWPGSSAPMAGSLRTSHGAATTTRRPKRRGRIPASMSPIFPVGWPATPGPARRAIRCIWWSPAATRRRPGRQTSGIKARPALSVGSWCGVTRWAAPSCNKSRPGSWPTRRSLRAEHRY